MPELWPHNFPDPQIIPTGDGYLAIATNSDGTNVQTLHSPDLAAWRPGADALPTLPTWTRPGRVWAPEAVRLGDRWLLYYTTRGPNDGRQCVSVAVADRPAGPYLDESTEPLVYEQQAGGSIDASPFTDSAGRDWLTWKNDGNAVGADTWISIQRLAPDGLSLIGEPVRLIKQDQPWEGNLVEGPYLWERDGAFHLFYSANDFGSADYAVGHAIAEHPDGPYRKDGSPILVSNEVAAGPGHCTLFADGDRTVMAYHAWHPDAVGKPPGRTLWTSEVHFAADGAVAVDPPAL